MGSTNCMNEVCLSTVSSEWKKGWSLKSGGFATLCYNCGSAYENSFFCETFHSDESGWRECKMCRKRIHCGCIVSRYLHEYMDFGGVGCISCVKRFEMHPVQPMQILSDIPNGTFVTNGRDNGTRDLRPIIENKIQDDRFSTERLLQLTKAIEANDVNSPLQQPKRDDFMLKTSESSKRFPNFTQPYTPSPFLKEKGRPKQGVKDMYESPAQPSLNYSRMNTSSNPVLPFPVGIAEKGEQNKGSSQQGQRTRHILPKPVKPIPVEGSENNNNNNSNNNNNNNNTTNTNNNNNNNYNKASVSQPRVARPPAEGRGRNQLLPRYWPRITDQELQQLSGDLKSTIVPLFEKILSASDAGRIGRLVLPKACAEAYFPAINQSEGIPIRIQDIKGKEWTFQFRFWPNNNSRMYVLEGVTPCIQTMQLQAGDTVTFSRIDPGGQLVIGCQKATNADAHDSQASYIPNGDSAAETSFSGAIENVPNGKTSDHMSMSEKKKAGNVKNKSLLMHSEDAMELRVTWEEAQELLCPSPDSEPAVVIVEELEFEEFQEPPVFGKRTIFTSRPSGEQEQLAQCDTCSKWRRLPVNALLSAKWTCSDNIWDSNRSSCSAREDINTRDLEFYLGTNKDFKQRRISEHKLSTEGEPFGLDVNEQTVTDTHFEQDEPLPIDVIKGKARVQDEEPKQEPYHPSIFLADTPEPEFEKFLEKYQRWMLLRSMDIEDIQEYVENKGWEPRVELEKLVRIFGHGKPYKVLMNSRYLDHLMQTAIADWQKVVAEIFGQTGEVPRETAPSKGITIRELSPTVQPEQLPQQSPTHRAETALVESTTDQHKEPSQDEDAANVFVETTVQQKERVVQEAENAKVDATSAQLEEMTNIANVEKDSQNEELVETAVVEKDIPQEERAETVLADKDSQQKESLLNLEAKTALEDSTLDLSKEIEIGKHAANALVEATTDQPKEDAEKQLGQETQLAITVVAPKDADLLQQSQATKATVDNADVRQFSESDWVDTVFSDDQATKNPSTAAEQSQQVLIVKSVNELINIDTYIPDAQAVEDMAHELDNLPLGKSLKRKTHIDSSGTEDSQHEQRRRRLVELTARSKFIASQTFPFQVMREMRKSNKKLKEVNNGLE